MSWRVAVVLVCLVLVWSGLGVVVGASSGGCVGEDPEIRTVYPNPVPSGDRGEFIAVQVPPGVNISEYALADQTTSVALSVSSPETVQESRTITFSTAANRTRRLTDRRVEPLRGHLQLANDGDHIRLLRNGTVVDSVEYGHATESSVYNPRTDSWRPLGATERTVVTDTGGTVEAFVLPDEPERAQQFLGNATERILLAGYTITSEEVVDTLIDAHDRGVTVKVLAEGRPVGGMAARGATASDRLARSGVQVQVLGGENARYRYHHAKYAVVDGRALVTTENWKPSGTGGQSSRGWGVITGQQRIVAGLVTTFEADTGWVDSIQWTDYDDETLVTENDSDASYPTAFDARTLPVEETRLFVAPDNAESELIDTIDNAEKSIDIKQVAIGDREFPFLRAALRAAERGVEVRILLSGAWYAETENRALASYLTNRADTANLPLSVRVNEPDGKFEKIHAKGMIVDGETTVLGSLNWNNNSVRNNREVGVVVQSDEVAAYFGNVFDSDWKHGDKQRLPLGYLVLCAVLAGVAVVVAARLDFGPE